MNIEASEFGSIVINGKTFDHDVVIFPDKIEERKKWITKDKHGTSHKFTKEEMEEYLQKANTDKIKTLIVGTGQYGKLGLLPETRELLEELGIEVKELETPEAVKYFIDIGESREEKLGIFHITC